MASIRDALKDAVTRAMKARDRSALSVYRTALAAIDNAEAVPLDESAGKSAIELSARGLGASEAARRQLTEQEMVDIARREVAERQSAADAVASHDVDAAQRLRDEAALLDVLLKGYRVIHVIRIGGT